MVAPRQMKINSYANKLTHTALTTIDNIEILQEVINFIELYKNREITKHELRNRYAFHPMKDLLFFPKKKSMNK